MPWSLGRGLLVIAILSGLGLVAGGASGNDPDILAERIRSRLESALDPDALAAGDERLLCIDALATFYENRGYRPAWSDGKRLSKAAAELLKTLDDAWLHGLQPADYHVDLIRDRVSNVKRSRNDAELDLLLSDAFLLYGSHLLSGQVNPETIDSEWFANRRGGNLPEILQSAIDSARVRAALSDLAPPQRGYSRLQEALEKYRRIDASGGWASIPEGEKLKAGMEDPRVPALRERLKRTGDLPSGSADTSGVFDEVLVAAVVRFQRRHGLDADGVIGSATLDALNVPAARRVQQIIVNLERWRWLPQELGERHVIVNVADFHLDCVHEGDTVLTSRVIVGRDYRRTPVFSDELSYIVFNPSWEVPDFIAAEDILPLVRKDPAYLERMGFDVLRGWGPDEKRFDGSSIDWKAVNKRSFPYRLRQGPGPLNALGRMKFMFPNRFSVYLHDTPARELFGKTERTFSSGCIRVEKPLELAIWLLAGDTAYDKPGIQALLDSNESRTVKLPRRVPIHLLYWTSWVSPDGTVYFRRDVYNRDGALGTALRQEPPVASDSSN